MKTIIKDNLRFIIVYSILVVIGIFVVIWGFNNYSMYKEPIVKITEVNDILVSSEEVNGYKENVYKQDISAVIKNGEDKGRIVKISNEYHYTQAYDQKYKVGDEIFISLNKRDGKIISTNIDNYKRDKYLILISVVLVLTIILVGKVRGFLSIFSVVINIILFYVIIHLNTKGISLVLLSYIGAILFSAICLFLVSGFSKKSLATIVSSIISVSIIALLGIIVYKVNMGAGIHFEQMELLTRPYEEIFLAELILGGLGAIMDISITMASSLNELIDKNNKISVKALSKSGITIGKDVMGTMINVLFFTYICSVIPNLVIYFRNGLKVGNLLNEFISLEMARALVGAIGIVITIPIAISISLLFFKGRLKK